MGVKTSKYFKVISIIDEDNQEHYGILVERIHDSVITKLGCLPVPEGRVTHKTLSDIQNLLQKFEQHPNLSISDLSSSIMDITLKYFDVLTPISLNLLIQSTSLFNRSTESSSSRLSSSCKNNKSGLFFKV
jgi:hypothetical protein